MRSELENVRRECGVHTNVIGHDNRDRSIAGNRAESQDYPSLVIDDALVFVN